MKFRRASEAVIVASSILLGFGILTSLPYRNLTWLAKASSIPFAISIGVRVALRGKHESKEAKLAAMQVDTQILLEKNKQDNLRLEAEKTKQELNLLLESSYENPEHEILDAQPTLLNAEPVKLEIVQQEQAEQ
ncbi:MAG: hypothetical protein OHK0017_08400 [Patescibacteria group bacterium]